MLDGGRRQPLPPFVPVEGAGTVPWRGSRSYRSLIGQAASAGSASGWWEVRSRIPLVWYLQRPEACARHCNGVAFVALRSLPGTPAQPWFGAAGTRGAAPTPATWRSPVDRDVSCGPSYVWRDRRFGPLPVTRVRIGCKERSGARNRGGRHRPASPRPGATVLPVLPTVATRTWIRARSGLEVVRATPAGGDLVRRARPPSARGNEWRARAGRDRGRAMAPTIRGRGAISVRTGGDHPTPSASAFAIS
jgi:hypothetical protein